MAKSPPPNRILSSQELAGAINKLRRRLADIEAFDIETVQERFDDNLSILAGKVDSTLEEILGADTSDFFRYRVGSFDSLPLIMGGPVEPLDRVKENNKKELQNASSKLNALIELLQERIADTLPVVESFPKSKPSATREVFIVHGHDNGTKETVSRFIAQLDLHPIVLHEKANGGKTIIEKFELHSKVDYAVVLATPDDIGYPKDASHMPRPRARQNVILELGFFLGALGRGKVCVLIKGDIELPSDYSGVLYLPMDDGGAWRFLLGKEMKAAGIDVDLNKLI